MKNKSRNLISLFIAVTMAISAVPTATAACTERVVPEDDIIWRASKSDASKVKGDALDADGNLTLGWTPDSSGATSVTINDVTFNYYITHSTQNGGWSSSDGAATGPSLKFSAPDDGVFTVYVTNLNSQKTFYISEGGSTSQIVIDSVFGSEVGSDCALSINVENGKDYYAYVGGSKGKFCGAAFEANEEITVPESILENGDFESGLLSPFTSRSSECSIYGNSAHGGNYCAYVSGRSASWTGIEYDINSLIAEGGIYHASVWLKLADNADANTDHNFYLQVELQESGQSSVYPIVDTKKAETGTWIELSGTFSLADYSLPLSRAFLYVCSADSNTADFYVDDFEMYAVNSTGSENPPITEFPTDPIAVTTSSAEVNFNNKKQKIEGFGASGAFGTAQSIKDLPTAKREEALSLLFDKEDGIGLTVLRNMLTPEIGATEGVIDLSADAGQGWLMEESRKYGVEQIMTTCWTPPAWMKTNNSTIGGSLDSEHYSDFASYLAGYVEAYKAKGIDIDIISPCNEPDLSPTYDGCTWTAEQIADFVKNYLKPELKERLLDTKILAAEEMRFREDKLSAVLGDAEAVDAVDIFGVHGYATKTFSHLTGIEATGKPLWMTEIMGYHEQDNTIIDGLLWAKRIHQTVAQAGANEWNFWYLAHQYDGGNSSLLVLNKYEDDFVIPKRLYTIGNYSKFVRPGANRVESTLLPNSDVYLSAYKNSDGSEVIVAANGNVNAQTVNIKLSGTDEIYFDTYRTSETESLTNSGTVTRENDLLSVELPPRSVTTYVSVGLRENELIRHGFSNESDVALYNVYSESGTLSYNNNMLLGKFESNWNDGNGIRLDITDFVKENSGCVFEASADLLRDNYYETAANFFVEIVREDGIVEKIMLESKTGKANELTTYNGTATLTYSGTERVYLCMTHPTGYQLYDNISLKISEDSADDEIPTQQPITEVSVSLSEDNKTVTVAAPESIDSAVLIIAGYNENGTLGKVNIKTLSDISAGETSMETGYTDGKIKVFLLDGTDKIKPLCNMVEN